MVGLLAGVHGRLVSRVGTHRAAENIFGKGKGKIRAEGGEKIRVRYIGGYGLAPTGAVFTLTIPNLYPRFTLPIFYLILPSSFYHSFTPPPPTFCLIGLDILRLV